MRGLTVKMNLNEKVHSAESRGDVKYCDFVVGESPSNWKS